MYVNYRFWPKTIFGLSQLHVLTASNPPHPPTRSHTIYPFTLSKQIENETFSNNYSGMSVIQIQKVTAIQL